MEEFDRILVMRRGAIIEQGTHADLLAADGPYARTWSLQDAGPDPFSSRLVRAG